MAVHDNEKKNRVARDFRRVLIVLVIIFIAILGRQEYKIHQIQKETEATQKRVKIMKSGSIIIDTASFKMVKLKSTHLYI